MLHSQNQPNNNKSITYFELLNHQNTISLKNFTHCNLNNSNINKYDDNITFFDNLKLMIVNFLILIHLTFFIQCFNLKITKIPQKIFKMQNLKGIKCKNNNIN